MDDPHAIRPQPRAAAGRWILALLAGWGAIAAFVGFAGEVAINDDFAYLWAVRTALEHGTFERLPWTWVPIFTSTGWGLLFTGAGGYSVAVLRFSSWVAGGIGLLALFEWMREAGAGTRVAFFATATLALNPIFINLAFTFMTEPFFLATCLVSLAAYARSLRTGSRAALLLGVLCALLATLTRQVGLALGIAYAVAAILGTREKGRWACVAIANAVPIAGYALFVLWTSGAPAETYGVTELATQAASRNGLWHLSRQVVEAAVSLGIFLLPLLGWLRPGRWAAPAFVVGGIAAVGIVWLFGSPPAPWGNILRVTGVGPSGIHGEGALPAFPEWAGWGLTMLGGGVAAAWLAAAVHTAGRDPTVVLRSPQWLLPLAFGATILAPHITRSPFFDRYILLALPSALVILAVAWGPRRVGPAALAATAVALVGLGAFGAIEARFGLDRARAQWALLDGLGVSQARIDGGFSWNASHYDWERRPHYSSSTRIFVDRDDLLLSFEPVIEGYVPLRQTRVSRVCGWGEQVLTLHQRIGSEPIRDGAPEVVPEALR